MKPLSGVTLIELAGIGPGPFCGMLLADLGADVILVERPAGTPDAAAGDEAPKVGERHAIARRGKRSIALDLKNAADRERILQIVRRADGMIEGMRPGTADRLGLGPAQCLAVNPRLVYGHITGWGQHGPLAQAAGHDINYTALSGALWYASPPGQAPCPPPTLLGDIGAGALYLAVGMLAAILRARTTGQGAVIDAAMVDGSAHMMNLLLAQAAAGYLKSERGESLFDGPHWSGTYRCADGGWISVQALEPKFYRILLDKLGLADDADFSRQYDADAWPALRERFAQLFSQRTREQWCELLEGTDACFAPVLSPDEAARHPHIRAREIYVERDGVRQAAAAPRFVGEPAWTPPPIPKRGEHTAAILDELGIANHPDNGT
ncbi:CaiB/BaiF CoA transferase family protein [Paraburkholderia acidipaludis]|uniref:CaiB/BaiF CoA transferase family protein n=1 Tax=Paraburkholderia acidipaludis TaxID=660537 RepID=UPI00048961A4|nr:CaiB/BaiF CoA-transferase family protein [Paraburkholderia acidipaludis]